jgi:hypothetical protein
MQVLLAAGEVSNRGPGGVSNLQLTDFRDRLHGLCQSGAFRQERRGGQNRRFLRRFPQI